MTDDTYHLTAQSAGSWQKVTNLEDPAPAGDAITKSQIDKTIMEPVMEWYKAAVEAERQAELRKRYPALQLAWDNYLFTLRMTENEPDTGVE